MIQFKCMYMGKKYELEREHESNTSIIIYKHTFSFSFIRAPFPSVQALLFLSISCTCHSLFSLVPHSFLTLLQPRLPAGADQRILYRLLHLANYLMGPRPLLRHHLSLLCLHQFFPDFAELCRLVPHLGQKGNSLLLLEEPSVFVSAWGREGGGLDRREGARETIHCFLVNPMNKKRGKRTWS